MKVKIAKYILAVLVGIIAIGGVFQIVYRFNNSNIIRDSENLSANLEGLWEENYIEYKGQTYKFNKQMKTYLIMGIDKIEPLEKVDDWTQGGQSDAMFLLLVDKNAKEWKVVAINRNLITELYTFDENQNFAGLINAQICVQHGFGDGLGVSCENSVSCVSKTFWMLPIDGYISMGMGAVPTLNDALGGVTVTSIEDVCVDFMDLDVKEGETITLHGMQALGYVKRREMEGAEGATKRLERQKQYIMTVYEMIKNSNNKFVLITELFNIANDYIYMDVPVIELAYQILSYDKELTEIYSIPGHDEMDGEYTDFIMDDNAALDLLVSLYYSPVDKEEIPKDETIAVISLE